MAPTFALPESIMQDQAQAVANSLTGAMAQMSLGGVVTLNASALVQFDSSALAVVLACRRAVLGCGGEFHLVNLPQPLIALAQVYGVTELLH